MENTNPASNPITEADQLPEADSLPVGFVDSTSENLLVPETPIAEEENPDFTDYKEEKLVEPDRRPEVVIDDLHVDKSPPVASESEGCKLTKEIVASESAGLSCQEKQSLEKFHAKGSDSQVVHVKETSLQPRAGNTKKGASEVKEKNAKRTFKSDKDFLDLTLKYQRVLAERDSATIVRDKLESLCRELQRQNKVLMVGKSDFIVCCKQQKLHCTAQMIYLLQDECKRVSLEGQNLRSEFSSKFEDAIKEVSNKLKEQKDECLSQLQENEMLKIKLNELTDQYTLSEQQFAQKLKQKTLELQLADLKLKQHEEKLVQEQSQMKLYAEQVSELLATEKNLRLQLTADGEKFQQFQEALVKSNDVFETFKQEIEKMAKSMKELKKENTFLKSKSEKSDVSLIELVEEREHLKKQLERTRNQKEKLEALCRSLRAEHKANSSGSSNSDAVAV